MVLLKIWKSLGPTNLHRLAVVAGALLIIGYYTVILPELLHGVRSKSTKVEQSVTPQKLLSIQYIHWCETKDGVTVGVTFILKSDSAENKVEYVVRHAISQTVSNFTVYEYNEDIRMGLQRLMPEFERVSNGILSSKIYTIDFQRCTQIVRE